MKKPRFSIVVSDCELHFSKKTKPGHYFALDLGDKIPSEKTLKIYLKLISEEIKKQLWKMK